MSVFLFVLKNKSWNLGAWSGMGGTIRTEEGVREEL